MGDESSGPGGPRSAENKTIGVLPLISILVLVPIGAVWLTKGSAPPDAPPGRPSPPAVTNPLADTTPVVVPPPVDSAGVRTRMFAFEIHVFHILHRPPGAVEALKELLGTNEIVVGDPRASTPESTPSVFLTLLPHQRFYVPLPKPLVFAKPVPSEAEIDAILDPREATQMLFEGPTAAAPSVYLAALSAAQKLEAAAPGVVWDDTTKEMFTRKTWATRMQGWTRDIPDIAGHVRIETTSSTEGTVRLMTRGMAKLGLPDLIANEVVGWQRERMTNLLLLVAQTLVEGGLPQGGAELDVEIATLGNANARARLSRGLASGAKRTKLTLGSVRARDAENAFVEVAFPGSQGLLPIRQQMVLDEVFGSDTPVRVVPQAPPTPN